MSLDASPHSRPEVGPSPLPARNSDGPTIVLPQIFFPCVTYDRRCTRCLNFIDEGEGTVGVWVDGKPDGLAHERCPV